MGVALCCEARIATRQDKTRRTYSDTNLADDKTQSCQNIALQNTESPDVQKYGCVLHDFIQLRSFSQVIKLLEDNHPFSEDDLDKALILACQSGHTHTVQCLIDHGASVQVRDPDGNTPLMICSKQGLIELVQVLLARETDFNAANSAGDTALILCIQFPGSTEIVKLLLQQKEIEFDHLNGQGYTALMKAVEMCDFNTAYILLELHFQKYSHMSDPWSEMHNSACKNYKGETTADMFEKQGLGILLKMFTQYIQHKTLDEKNKTTPLNIAVQACDVKLLDTFLDCVDLDQKDKTRMVNNAYRHFFEHDLNQITKSQMSMVKRLLELGADVNGRPSVFPLCEATRAGSFALVELLCQHGADFNKTNCEFGHPPLGKKYQHSPVNEALIRGHTDCAKLLIQHGAKVNIKSALHGIIYNQDVNYINFLFEFCRHETHKYIIENRHDLLMLAVRQANVEIISHILDIGVDTTGKYPCLEQLLAESGNGEVARFLIQKGADVNKMIETFHGKCTPLYMVIAREMCLSSRLQVVQVLLENGASPNIHGEKSPLMLAALTVDSTDLLQLLLDNGADLNWRDKDGDTAFVFSIFEGCNSNAEFLVRYAKDKRFVNSMNNYGLTALMHAVRFCQVTVVKNVLNLGPELNKRDDKGNTALLHAINRIYEDEYCNVVDIVVCLVNAGCDVNYQNWDGVSPLMLATIRESCEVIKILLDAGADVNAVITDDMQMISMILFQPPSINEDSIIHWSRFLFPGAFLSYLPAITFRRILLSNDSDIIYKVVISGRGLLSAISSCKYHRYISDTSPIFDVSPLCITLLGGNIFLARHFIKIMFLTTSDLSPLMYKLVRAYLEKINHRQYLNVLDEMFSQPMSLFRLTFVTVSSAVGLSPGREKRVNMLPLPQKLKDELLFKSPAKIAIHCPYWNVYFEPNLVKYPCLLSGSKSCTDS